MRSGERTRWPSVCRLGSCRFLAGSPFLCPLRGGRGDCGDTPANPAPVYHDLWSVPAEPVFGSWDASTIASCTCLVIHCERRLGERCRCPLARRPARHPGKAVAESEVGGGMVLPFLNFCRFAYEKCPSAEVRVVSPV